MPVLAGRLVFLFPPLKQIKSFASVNCDAKTNGKTEYSTLHIFETWLNVKNKTTPSICELE